MLVSSMYNLCDLPQPKTKTPQSIRDNEKVKRRIRINGEKFDQVSNYIDKYFGIHVTIAILTSLAKIVTGKHKVKLDRLARRNRAALLCWYTENWDIIHPILKDAAFRTKIKKQFMANNEKDQEKCIQQGTIGIKDDVCIDPSDISYLLNYHN